MECLVFRDRAAAGRQLARQLEHVRQEQPIVIGLPRGGVAVAYEVARALEAPLDVVVARKLGAPFQPELAIGAIAPGGVLALDHRFGLTETDLDPLIRRERAEMERRLQQFRGGEALPDVTDRTVILVDDGVATGYTALAAVQALRTRHPRRIILAVPVAPESTLAAFEADVDEVVCLLTPENFIAIGAWYLDFLPVSDDEVTALLERARRLHSHPKLSPTDESPNEPL